MRVVVVGGVVSTELLVNKLVEHGFSDVLVFGFEPDDTTNVSGWADLSSTAKRAGFEYSGFKRVRECETEIREYAPDILFAVGLSQIIPPSILSIAKVANVGFHPTMLPQGRGRAALAWLIIEGQPGAATFFEMGSDVDDGPIYVQKPYGVTESDDVASIEEKLLQAEALALDSWLPDAKRGTLTSVVQDSSKATWFGRRTPDDGCIDWGKTSKSVCRLIRASAPPHPGAFTFSGDHQITVLSAEASARPERGVVGRILKVFGDGSFEVQAGEGLVKVLKWNAPETWEPKVGSLLGYYEQLEIYRLRAELGDVSNRLERLEALWAAKE